MFDIKKFLSNIFLFEGLSLKELSSLSEICSSIHYDKNEILFNEGQEVDSFYVLAYGKVKICRLSSSGNEQILHIQKDGDLIAEAAIFDDRRYPASAVALEDSLVIKVDGEKFKKILRNNTDLGFKVMAAYSRRLKMSTKKIEELTTKDIKARLAKYLIEHSYNNIVSLNISKKELASNLGTIPETLSRTLQFFKKEGLISETKKEITIKNSEKLLKLT